MQRMKLYVSGVKVPKLGSLQDRILEQYLVKEAQKESKKVHFLALIAANSVQFGKQDDATTWEKKIKKIFNSYLELEFGVEIPEQTEQEIQMQEYYDRVIKPMKLKLKKNENGTYAVQGLEALGKLR